MTKRTQRLVGRSVWPLALGVCLAGNSAGLASTLTGREIMEKQRQLHHLQDEEERRLMTMVDASGQERRRELSGYVMTTGDDQSRCPTMIDSFYGEPGPPGHCGHTGYFTTLGSITRHAPSVRAPVKRKSQSSPN